MLNYHYYSRSSFLQIRAFCEEVEKFGAPDEGISLDRIHT